MNQSNEREQAPTGPSDAAMAQLYRGELGRSDRWRTRLDTTTNWALTTAAATASFGFGSSSTSHVVILIGLWMVLTFLYIETRRYRYYDLWIRRVRLLEDGFWVPLLRHEPVDPEALRELTVELERPQIRLTFTSAIQIRLSRAYGVLLVVLVGGWFAKVYSQPTRVNSVAEFFQRAHVGPVPGWLVTFTIGLVAVFFLGLLVLSRFSRMPAGELQTRPRAPGRSMWESLYRPYLAPRARQRARQRRAAQHSH